MRCVLGRIMDPEQKNRYRIPTLAALFFAIVSFLLGACVQGLYIPPAILIPRWVQAGELPLELGWQTRLDERVVREPVVVGDHLLLMTAGYLVGSSLIRLDTRTGAVAWRAPLPGGAYATALPIEADGMIFLGGENEKGLVALDAATGQELWSRRLDEGIFRPTTAGVAYAAGRVFAASATTGTVYAFDAGDGRLLWDAWTDDSLRGADLQVVGNLLHVFTGDHVYQFDTRTGKWVGNVKVDLALGGAQHTPDRLFTLDRVFDAATFQQIASLQTPHELDPALRCTGYSLPFALTADAIYAAGGCGVYRLSPQGEIQWAGPRTPRPNELVGVYGSNVYVLLDDGAIVALDAADGRQVARLKTAPGLLGYSVGIGSSRGLVGTPCGVVAVFNSYDVWGFVDPSAPGCQRAGG